MRLALRGIEVNTILLRLSWGSFAQRRCSYEVQFLLGMVKSSVKDEGGVEDMMVRSVCEEIGGYIYI